MTKILASDFYSNLNIKIILKFVGRVEKWKKLSSVKRQKFLFGCSRLFSLLHTHLQCNRSTGIERKQLVSITRHDKGGGGGSERG